MIEVDTCFRVLSIIALFPLSGKRFYAHRTRLLAASDAFQAICGAGYRVYVSFTLQSFPDYYLKNQLDKIYASQTKILTKTLFTSKKIWKCDCYKDVRAIFLYRIKKSLFVMSTCASLLYTKKASEVRCKVIF